MKIVKLDKAERERLGMKRIMSDSEFTNVLHLLGNDIEPSTVQIGMFAVANGYERCHPSLPNTTKRAVIYKLKGTPTPKVVVLSYKFSD